MPRRSGVTSRLDVDLAPGDGTPATLPIVSANMNSVTGPRLAATLARRGGLGVLPQDMPLQELDAAIRWVKGQPVAWDTPARPPAGGDRQRGRAAAAGDRRPRHRRRAGAEELRGPPHRRDPGHRARVAARHRAARCATRRSRARPRGLDRRRRRRERAPRLRPDRRAPRPRRCASSTTGTSSEPSRAAAPCARTSTARPSTQAGA